MLVFVLVCYFSYCFCQVPAPDNPSAPPENDDYNTDEEEYCMFFESPVAVCKDPLSKNYFDTSKLETVRHNETMAYMKGSFEFIIGLQEHTMIEIVLTKEWNGRFDTVLTHQICSLCDEVGNPESDYYPFLVIFPGNCPFEKGVYEIGMVSVDTSDFPINAKNSGRYQATMNLYFEPSGNCQSDKEFMACVMVGFIIEPC